MGKKSIRTLLLFFVLAFLAQFFLTKQIKASSTLFFDDFEDESANGWEEHNPWGSWIVENGDYVGNATLLQSPAMPSYTIVGDQSWDNYTYETTLNATLGIDKQILFRVNKTQNRAYIFNLRSGYFDGGNDAILAKRFPLGSENAILLALVPYANPQNGTYKIIAEVKNEGSSVYIKIYVNDELVIDYVDSDNPIYNGGIGLEVVPGGYLPNALGLNLVTEIHYQYAKVSTIGGNYLPVPDLKQYDPLWKDEEYDSAHLWAAPSEYTIERWGCAVTSAAMILSHNGHSTTPDTLNTYLKQHNGYTRNGGILWNKVSKYSKDNESESSPALEFNSGKPFDATDVQTSLNSNIPVVVKLKNPTTDGTHFVVIKGAQDTDFVINDPATTNTLLSHYPSEQYNSMYSFTPSHTDLSYIQLLVDEGISMKVYDPDGNEIIEGFGKEEPLEDQVSHISPNTETLNSFSLAKPQPGVYRIELTGSIPYQLDSYLFDKDGDSIDQSITGSLEGKAHDTLFVTIGENDNIQKLNFEYILSEINNAYASGKIHKKAIYVTLKSLVEGAKRQENKNHSKISKLLLNLAVLETKKLSGKGIETQFASELISNMKLLRESF